MTDQPRLWDSLVEQASSGELTVDLDRDTFDAIDQAFDSFLREIATVQVEVREFGARPGWGLAAAGEQLIAARDTLAHLTAKAVTGENSAQLVLTQYAEVAARIRAMFQAMHQTYRDTEAEIAQQILAAEGPR